MPLDRPPPSGRHVVRGACPHDCPDTCALLTTVRGRPRDRDPRRAGPSRRRAASCARRSRATSTARIPTSACCIRCGASAARAKAASSASPGTRRSRRSPTSSARSPRRPTARRRSCRTATPERWACCSTASMDRRFFHRLGASLLDRTICATAGKAGWTATIGAAIGMDVEQFANSRLILIWGSNPIASNLHFWTRAQEAKRRGARLVAIDPYRSATAEKCHQHIALLPGTDGALALGPDARADRGGPRRPRLRRPLHDRVSRSSRRVRPHGRPSASPRSAASPPRKSWRSRATTARRSPPRSALNYGMQRVAGGGNAVRAIACLPALVGAWRDPAGGALLSSSGTYPVDHHALERPDLIRGRPRTINMSAIGDALLDARRPADPRDLRLQLESGRRRARVRRACARASRARTSSASCTRSSRPTPPTSPTSCCRRPRSSSSSTCTASYGHLYALANNPAIAPLGEALPNTEVFRRLAARMGFTEPCFGDSDETMARAGVEARPRRRARPRLGHAAARRLAAPRRARRLRAVRAGRLPDAVGQVRIRERDAGGAGTRSAARLRPAARVGGEQSRTRAALSAGVHLAAGAQLPQLVVRQPAGVRGRGAHAAPRSQSRPTRRRAASPTATSCASSTTAAASRRPRA